MTRKTTSLLLFTVLLVSCKHVVDSNVDAGLELRLAKLSKLMALIPIKTEAMLTKVTRNVTLLATLGAEMKSVGQAAAPLLLPQADLSSQDLAATAAMARSMYGAIALFQNELQNVVNGLQSFKKEFEDLSPALAHDLALLTEQASGSEINIDAIMNSFSNSRTIKQTPRGRQQMAEIDPLETQRQAMISRAKKTVTSDCTRDIDQCFDLGYEQFKQDNYVEALKLYEAAWYRFNNSEQSPTGRFTDALIIDYISYCDFKMDDGRRAVVLAEYLLTRSDLDDEWINRLKSNMPAYLATRTKQLANMNPDSGVPDQGRTEDEETESQRIARANNLHGQRDYLHCRNESDTEPVFTYTNTGFCRYSTRRGSPYLLLQPVKEEVFSLDPPIVMFHELMTESEIIHIKAMGVAKMEAAGVVDATSKNTQVQRETRRAKVAWLEDETLPRLAQRIMEYTALNMVTSEMFQLGAYNVSGHYIPHYDLLFYSPYIDNEGDRIATLLIYMNEVDGGGQTVFPRAGRLVVPVEGSGVFWYNQYKNTTDDLRSLHGACPVMSGQKWVINKWFRARGQEFTRPCGLSPDERFSIADMDAKFNYVRLKTPM